MPDTRKKGSHRLHESISAQDFLCRLEREAGSPSLWHPTRFVAADRLEGLVLGGSIPLGIASPASDVDLIAVVRELNDLPATFSRQEALLFAGRREDSAHVILLCNHVEIDISFVAMPRISAIYQAVCCGGAMPPTSDVRLLSRLKRGWILSASLAFAHFLDTLRDDRTVEVRCSVTNFIFALQTLEDAVAALPDNLPLSLHLGRLCVEWAMQAYFASLGELHVGDKWLRLARRGVGRCDSAPDSTLPGQAERLLFPELNLKDEWVVRYLDEVRMFTSRVRSCVEQDPALRLAFRICPQIGDGKV